MYQHTFYIMHFSKICLAGLLAWLLTGVWAVAQTPADLPASALTGVGSEVRALGLPTVVVETAGGKEPDCKPIEAPEGCTGNGITDNDYVKGRLWIIDGDRVLYDSGTYDKGQSGMRVKVRGNSSAYTTHKSQKVKLEAKADLLLREGKDGQHKEWGLLNYYSTCDLKTVLGLWLGRRVAQSWEPAYRFVNLLQNGKYKGIYLLSELITEGKGRCQLKEDELLVEADPYWWTKEQTVLHTDRLPYALAYTFKYPDDTPSNEQFLTLKNGIAQFEQALYEQPDQLEACMEMESFARWVLVHDLLGSRDGYGSNIFMVVAPGQEEERAWTAAGSARDDAEKESGDEDSDGDDADEDGGYRLRMGPLWDFGSAFETPEKWASIHDINDFYFSRLFKIPAFAEVYVRVWEEVRTDLQAEVHQMLSNFSEHNGTALKRSRSYQNTALPEYPMAQLSAQLVETNQWMEQRIAWMDAAIEEMLVQNGVEHADAADNPIVCARLYNLSGQLVGNYTADAARSLLNGTNLPNNHLPQGVYVLEVLRKQGSPQRIKKIFR